MSIQYLSWAFGTTDATLGPRLVLFALADDASDRWFTEDGPMYPGICWPSVDRLAAKACLSRRQTFAAIKKLEDLGLVRSWDAREHGFAFKTTLRQLRGGADFAPLPDLGEGVGFRTGDAASRDADNTGGGEAGDTQSVKGTTSDTSLSSSVDEPAPPAAPAEAPPAPIKVPAAARYLDENAKTPGEKAARHFAVKLAQLMLTNNDQAKLPAGLVTLDAGGIDVSELSGPAVKWLDTFRLMVDADNRDAAEAWKVLHWCQADRFWHKTILSPSNFREHYDRLRLAWLDNGGRQTPVQQQGAAAAPSQSERLAMHQLDPNARRAGDAG